MFQLVFRGEHTTEVDEPTARANAMTLFKATIAQVERMFSGQQVVIRNRLDEATARKYQALLKKHGLLAYVESMGSEQPAPQPAAVQAEKTDPSPASGTATPSPAAQPAAGGVSIEPGDRPRVAGEKVDQILSRSSLSIAQPGIRLSEEREVPERQFEHLDEITVAPAGSDLGEKRESVPVPEPDISHLSLQEEEGDERR